MKAFGYFMNVTAVGKISGSVKTVRKDQQYKQPPCLGPTSLQQRYPSLFCGLDKGVSGGLRMNAFHDRVETCLDCYQVRFTIPNRPMVQQRLRRILCRIDTSISASVAHHERYGGWKWSQSVSFQNLLPQKRKDASNLAKDIPGIAANIVRAVRGAGKPEEFIRQCVDVLNMTAAFDEITHVFPSPLPQAQKDHYLLD
ncbi:hypothetical protein [Rhizobium lusitanum]|uniref:hypothetical protein n=1 Tax=Rhizobium lusitanum TaxID=293958 RepID=UPI003F4AD4A9